jgi:hypothetical protein
MDRISQKRMWLTGASLLAIILGLGDANAVVFGGPEGVQYIIPSTGYYDFTVAGAQGGGGLTGGLGAVVGGELFLNAGATLDIVVGGVGGSNGNYGDGGGGGSFVFDGELLFAAGGGGGANFLGFGATGSGTAAVRPALRVMKVSVGPRAGLFPTAAAAVVAMSSACQRQPGATAAAAAAATISAAAAEALPAVAPLEAAIRT